jgi:hypothetical protein
MHDRSQGAELGAMTVREFCARYKIGTTKFYEELGSGRLRAVKCGNRTLILISDAKVWENTLSAVHPPQSPTA